MKNQKQHKIVGAALVVLLLALMGFKVARPYQMEKFTAPASADQIINPLKGNAAATAEGKARPDLKGTWFNDGFRGAMGALLVAIEDDAEPANGAAENLRSLALAFAAIQSARSGREVAVGSVTRMEV